VSCQMRAPGMLAVTFGVVCLLSRCPIFASFVRISGVAGMRPIIDEKSPLGGLVVSKLVVSTKVVQHDGLLNLFWASAL
jgi:hypothetical protein